MSSPDRRNTIKDVSERNAEELRKDALRLVKEGIVELEEDANAAYERQGNMAYYSEENLARRLAIRNHPLLKRLTCALWRLVCRSSNPMDYDGYSEVMIRLHKILMEHFNTKESYARIRNDWESDARGQNTLAYDDFHLSMFELVDLWCDSIYVQDYISLLYLMLEGITRIVDAKFVLRPLEEILYTDVVDAALQKSMHDIECIMASIEEEPVIENVVEKFQKQTLQDDASPKSEIAPPRFNAPDTAPISLASTPKALTVSTQMVERNESPRKFSKLGSEPAVCPNPDDQRAMREKSRDTIHKPLPPKSKFKLNTLQPTSKHNRNPDVISSMNSKAFDADDGFSSAIAPWEDIVQTKVPIMKDTQTPPLNYSTPLNQGERSVAQLANNFEKSQLMASQAESPEVSVPVSAAPSPPKHHKVSIPLEKRDFGGFSIMSPRDGQPQQGVKQTTSRTNNARRSNDGINFGVVQSTPINPSDEERNSAIRKAFIEQKRQSLVRKKTPPSLFVMEAKVDSHSMEKNTKAPPKEPKGKAMARKSEEFQRESVELVSDLASSTLGAAQDKQLPTSRGVRTTITPTFRHRQIHEPNFEFPNTPKNHQPEPHVLTNSTSDTTNGVPQLIVGLASIPRPTGAPKNMLPRRMRLSTLARGLTEANEDNKSNPAKDDDILHVEKISSPRGPIGVGPISEAPRLPKLITSHGSPLNVVLEAEHAERTMPSQLNAGQLLSGDGISQFIEHHIENSPRGTHASKLAPPKHIKPLMALEPTMSNDSKLALGDGYRPDLKLGASTILSHDKKDLKPIQNNSAIPPLAAKRPNAIGTTRKHHFEEQKFNIVHAPPLPSPLDFVTIKRAPKQTP